MQNYSFKLKNIGGTTTQWEEQNDFIFYFDNKVEEDWFQRLIERLFQRPLFVVRRNHLESYLIYKPIPGNPGTVNYRVRIVTPLPPKQEEEEEF